MVQVILICIELTENLIKNVIVMTIFNILLYGGLSLIVIGFIILIVSIIKLRGIEVEKFKQQQLHKSFMKNRKINK